MIRLLIVLALIPTFAFGQYKVPAGTSSDTADPLTLQEVIVNGSNTAFGLLVSNEIKIVGGSLITPTVRDSTNAGSSIIDMSQMSLTDGTASSLSISDGTWTDASGGKIAPSSGIYHDNGTDFALQLGASPALYGEGGAKIIELDAGVPFYMTNIGQIYGQALTDGYIDLDSGRDGSSGARTIAIYGKLDMMGNEIINISPDSLHFTDGSIISSDGTNFTFAGTTNNPAITNVVVMLKASDTNGWDVSSGGGAQYTVTFRHADLASGVLTVTHGLASIGQIVQVFRTQATGYDEIISPDAVSVSNLNTTLIDLTTFGSFAWTGRVTVAGASETAALGNYLQSAQTNGWDVSAGGGLSEAPGYLTGFVQVWSNDWKSVIIGPGVAVVNGDVFQHTNYTVLTMDSQASDTDDEDYCSIYIDYSASTAPYDLAFYDVDRGASATYNNLKDGYYNPTSSQDRVVGCVWTHQSSNIAFVSYEDSPRTALHYVYSGLPAWQIEDYAAGKPGRFLQENGNPAATWTLLTDMGSHAAEDNGSGRIPSNSCVIIGRGYVGDNGANWVFNLASREIGEFFDQGARDTTMIAYPNVYGTFMHNVTGVNDSRVAFRVPLGLGERDSSRYTRDLMYKGEDNDDNIFRALVHGYAIWR